MLTPEQLVEKGGGSEHAHQCAVMQWIAVVGRKKYQHLDLLFAIPNGGDRSVSVAAAMRAEGVKRGMPDLFLPVPLGVWAGLWIEMKKPEHFTKSDGGRTVDQARIHKRLIEQQYAVVVAYGWVAAVKAIRIYYSDLQLGEYNWMVKGFDDAFRVTEREVR